MTLDASILVRLSLAMREAAVAKYGTRGVAPRIRELLAADLADHDKTAPAPAPDRERPPKRERTPEQPDTRAPIRSGQPCPRCAGTVRQWQGALRCSATARHVWTI